MRVFYLGSIYLPHNDWVALSLTILFNTTLVICQSIIFLIYQNLSNKVKKKLSYLSFSLKCTACKSSILNYRIKNMRRTNIIVSNIFPACIAHVSCNREDGFLKIITLEKN